MLRKHINAILLIIIVLVCFVLGEILIRFLGNYEVDRNFEFRGRRLKPYHLPVKRIESKLNNYLSSSNSLAIYDSILGWFPRPNRRGKLYNYNSLGIRSFPTEYSMFPSKDKLRICIFGNSFTHGDEVVFENTWGYYLEQNLKERGINSEVINFGVWGYGIDQAFLRWRELGYKFSPDIVILGFQGENLKRNMNIFRAIYMKNTGMPFSKPRFILNGDSLELVNCPTVPIPKIIDIVKNFKNWKLSQHEYFFKPQNYHNIIWMRSRLISFIKSVIELNRFNHKKVEMDFYALDKDLSRITLKIIQKFKTSVTDQGGQFFVLHLPKRNDLSDLLNNRQLVYADLLSEIAKSHNAIFPEFKIIEEAKKASLDSLFVVNHYSGIANKIVGGVITEYMLGNDLIFNLKKPDGMRFVQR